MNWVWAPRHRLAGALLLAGLAVSRPPMAFTAVLQSMQIVPQPHEVKPAGAGFEPAKAKFICVSEDVADRFTARLLREALRETHGVDCSLVLLPQEAASWHRLWLGSSKPVPDGQEAVKNKGNESYALEVTSGGVAISAESDSGLFYGAQTLIQLLEQARREQAAVPGIVVVDWPTFQWRGRYFDGS